MNRKLSLRQEALADLTSDELGSLAGAASGLPCELVYSVHCPTTHTLLVSGCGCTGYYPSLNAPCDDILRIDLSNIC